jgi:hypothetical protein
MSDETLTVEVLAAEVAPVLAQARGIVVRTAEDRVQAQEFKRTIKKEIKRRLEWFAPRKAAARAVWQGICDDEAQAVQPLKNADMEIDARVGKYDADERARIDAERRRLEAAAQEQARKERERLEKEAARLKTPELREARLAQAEAVEAAPVILPPAPARVKGEYEVTLWHARVVNPSEVPREWCAPNQAGLDALAKATKGTVQVRGVEFWSETQKRMRA